MDKGAVFGRVSLARSEANDLETLIYTLEPEQQGPFLEALASLRKQLKEVHYMCIPWSS